MRHVHSFRWVIVRSKRTSIVTSTVAVIGAVFMLLDYMCSWRGSLLATLGSWCLGFLEGAIVTAVAGATIYAFGPSILATTTALAKLGSLTQTKEKSDDETADQVNQNRKSTEEI